MVGTYFWLPHAVLAFGYIAPLWLYLDHNLYTLKICTVLGHFLLLIVPHSECCLNSVPIDYWCVGIICVNVAVLYNNYQDQAGPRIPDHFQPAVSNLFREFPITHKDLCSVIQYARFTGTGQGEVWINEGALAPDNCLNLLITGRMGVYFQDVLLHEIKPSDFLNSIEWKANFVLGSEDFWRSQVELRVLEDSTIVMLDRGTLLAMEESLFHVWKRLLALLGSDILFKMKQTHWHVKEFVKNDLKDRVARNSLFRSLSLDALYISSDNLVGDPGQIPTRMKRFKAQKSQSSNERFNQSMVQHNLGLMYLWSKSELREDSNLDPLPSLAAQTLHSCEDDLYDREDVVRDLDWDKSWNHCGHCLFCWPLTEKESEIQAHGVS